MTSTTSPYLIAEIGGNHEGSFVEAKKMCRLAIESGADCIKFQLYKGDSLVNPVISPDRHAHFQKFELCRQEHIELAEMCRNAGRDYLASVWDMEMLEWIDPYLTHYKIGSGDLTATPLLRSFAERGKPMILSTGLATMAEVERSVSEIRQTNSAYSDKGMITLLQCTSMYPIPDADANLSVIRELAKIENVNVGYSDHTMGTDALLTAFAVGAQVLEFHFTDKREGREFRDHKVSLMVDEVKELKGRLGQLSRLLGDSEKRPLDIEISNGHDVSFRRAIYPAQDLPAGRRIEMTDLCCLRPAEGISAAEIDNVVGRTLLEPVTKLQRLDWFMFE